MSNDFSRWFLVKTLDGKAVQVRIHFKNGEIQVCDDTKLSEIDYEELKRVYDEYFKIEGVTCASSS